MGILQSTTAQVDQAILTGRMTSYPCRDTTDLLAAVTEINNSDIRGVIELQNGVTYTLSSTMIIDVIKFIIRMNGATIDALGIGSAPLFRFENLAGTNSFRQKPFSIEDGLIIGPTGNANAVCLYINGTSATKFPKIVAKNLSIENFGVAIDLKDYAAQCQFYSVDINGSNLGVRQQNGLTAGEAINFFGCSISNTSIAISGSNQNGRMKFFGGSLNNNSKLCLLTGGKVELNGTHIEATNTQWSTDYIDLDVDGTSLKVVGGEMYSTGGIISSATSIINLRNTNASMVMKNVDLSNLQTSTNKFATGSGKLTIEGSSNSSSSYNNLPSVVSDNTFSNLLSDGGFESTAVVDYWSITNDNGSVPTARLTGTKGTLTTSTSQFRSGARSLSISKTATGAFEVAVFVPAKHFSRFTSQLYHLTPASGGLGGATVSWSSGWAMLRGNDGNGVPDVTFTDNVTGTFIPTSTFTVLDIKHTTQIPSWATHCYVRFSIPTGTTGALFIDDMIANCY